MSTKSGTDSFDELVTTTLPSLVSEATAEGGRLYRSVMARVELPLLRHALELCGGNQLKAAKLLGINRNTLRKRLRLLGLLPATGSNGAKAGNGARPA
jgi:two-component system nitrogen regulation response regulator GlnG